MRILTKFVLPLLSVVLLLTTVFISSCKDDEPEPLISADFTSNQLQINAGEKILFSDLSEGDPTQWNWEFEGGSPAESTEQNPEIQFDSPGVWKVTLKASNQSHEETIVKQRYVTVLPVAGLVAYYPFDGNTNDFSSTGNDAVNQSFSSATNRFDFDNRAITLNGDDDYIEYDHHENIDFGSSDDFTISIWSKPNEQLDIGSSYNSIISKWYAHPDWPYAYTVRYWNRTAETELADSYYIRQWYSSSCDANELHRLNTQISGKDTWRHVVVVKNGYNIKVYINNSLVNEREISASELICDTYSPAPLFIGTRYDLKRFYTGSVDDFRIFNIPLDENGIDALNNEDYYLTLEE